MEVPAGITILQACELAGLEIPRFCYHERLSIAGNCRMCLVEVKPGPPKPQASCALPVADKQEIFTTTPMVQKARKGVMEFLLINHPLDCPICDQGGECDLQDQAMGYGFDRSRYHENKRAVPDKELGPLVKTSMNRCIHCTRCIRFATEVAGVEELGATGRGESMEVTTYVEHALSTELSGNLVDLCPVGALTSKPYAYEARSWELTKTELIDVLDALGSNIRIDTRGAQVMRVLPRMNDDVNEEWISDKTRHAIDGLRYQRLDRPYVRKAGKLVEATWDEAFRTIAERLGKLEGGKIAAIAGDQCDAELMVALKDLMANLGSPNIDCRQDGAMLDGPRGSYIFNPGIHGIDQADAILLVGTNPRLEAPVLNARIRKRYLHGGQVAIGSIGPVADLTYPVERLGAGPATLGELVEGRHGFFEKLKAAKNPLIIVGMGALAREDGAAVLALARELADKLGAVREDWNGFAVLHTAAARVGGLDLGLVPGPGGRDVEGILAGCEKGEIAARLPAGGRRDRHQAPGQGLRDLPGPSRRCRRPSRRCHPAGRRLHREARHLRQHRGPCAARLPRRLPAGRRPRGLGDPARPVGAPGQDPAVRHARPGAHAAGRREQHLRRARPAGRRALGQLRHAGQALRRAVRLADQELLHDLSDQPLVRAPWRSARPRARS